MRRSSWLLLAFAFVLCAAPFVQAQSPTEPAKLSLGADVALKVDYFHFFDSAFGDLEADNGILVSLEFYKEVFCPHFFLGVEAGWGTAWGTSHDGDDSRDTDVTYVPIEFNAKYVIPLAPNFALGLGAGVSMNYLNVDADDPNFGEVFSQDDWVVGGQFFAELDYKCHNWFFGAHVKYKITDEPDFAPGVSADNIAVGLNLGFLF